MSIPLTLHVMYEMKMKKSYLRNRRKEFWSNMVVMVEEDYFDASYFAIYQNYLYLNNTHKINKINF